MKYLNKDEYEFNIGDIVTADSDYMVSIPPQFYMTISELLYEDIESLDKKLIKVFKEYSREDKETSLGYDEIYVILKNVKITYEY